MKKSLIKLQILVVIVAVFVSSGYSAFHLHPEEMVEHPTPSAMTGKTHAAQDIQEMDCDGNDGHDERCIIDETQHSHINECCPVPSGLVNRKPVDPTERLGDVEPDNLVASLPAPPLRPPRFFS